MAGGRVALLALFGLARSASSVHLRSATSGAYDGGKDLLEDEQHFWVGQFSDLQRELQQLKSCAEGSHVADIQISAAPVNNSVGVANVSATEEHALKVNTSAIEVPVMKNAMTLLKPDVSTPAMKNGSAHSLSKELLPPMLAMLKGMYEEQKKRIGVLNTQEQRSKERFDKQKAEYEKRLAQIEDQRKNGLSADLAKNATEQATRFFNYWEQARERNHRMFHTSLKITHGSMQRAKQMIEAYEKAIGSTEPKQVSGQTMVPEAEKSGQAMPVPDVVLAQRKVEVARFCRDALQEVKRELRAAALHQAKFPSGI